MQSEVKKGAILSYVLIFLTNIIAITYTPFLIRSLGQSEYGLYSLVNSIIGYLTVLDLGFANAIIVYTAKYREKKDKEAEKKLHGTFLVIFTIIGIIATILGLILYFNVSNMFGNTMTETELKTAKTLLLILTFNLGVTFIFSVYTTIITSYEKFVFQKVLSIIITILNPIIMLPLLLMGHKSISLVIVVTILNIISLFSNYLYCKKKLKIKVKYSGMDKKLLKSIFAYSFFIFLNTIIDKVNWTLDLFILGTISGTAAVSIYSVASQFNNIYLSFSTAISGVLLPKITRMVEKKVSDEEISNEFIKTGRIQYFILFLIISGFTLFGKEFITLWVGEKYINAYYIGLILMIPVTIPLTQNVGISILQAKNMHKFRSIVLFIVALLNIALSIPLASKYSGIGSAIGTGISLIIGNVIIINIYYQVKAKINIIKYWKNIIRITLLEIVPIVFIIILIMFLPLEGVYKLLYIPPYVLIYIIYTYFVVMNNYEKNLIKGLTNKIFKKVEKMNNIIDKNKCTGCLACYNICPKSAISLIEDKEGFKYPVIDQNKCINCGLCKKVCPVLNSTNNEKKISAYACYNKDDNIRKNSSSGGIFNLLGNYILSENGIVFGAKYNKEFLVEHDYVTNKKELKEFMGSKYLQSNIKDNYKKVKKFLNEGKKVFFSGTPCQVEGLCSYLGKDYENLYTQDIICHGCPSPKVWKKYLNSFDKKINKVNMRDKENGWNDFFMNIKFEKETYKLSHNKDKYMYFFLANYSLRSSCYNCSFKKKYRKSDITLADFWGINNIKPKLNDDKGISLVIVNSKKGEELFNNIKKNLVYEEVDFEKSIYYNSAMTESVCMPRLRNFFFKDLDKKNFNNIYIKYKIIGVIFNVVNILKSKIKK